jgi:predicted ATPase
LYEIPYFVVVLYTDTSLEWFIYKSNAFLKKPSHLLKKLHISSFLPTIKQIHLNCFDLLHEKYEGDDTFTFYLRSDNRRKRLENGYFFLGNEHYCAISFWGGRDWKNKTPSIYIEINMEGAVRLILTAKDSEFKGKFLKQVGELVGAKQLKIKGELRSVWLKYYSRGWEDNYLEVLQEFLRVDKEIIDAQIFKEERKPNDNNNLGDIHFIGVGEFGKNLKKILSIRNQLNIENNSIVERIEIGSITSIKLQRIELENITMFQSFVMDLSARVTCIIGDNGTGKTSLLRAIVLGLVGANESTEMDAEQLKYKELQNLLQLKGLDEHNNRAYTGKGKISLNYKISENYLNIVFLEKERTSLDIILSDDINWGDFAVLSDANYFPNLIIAFTQGGSKSEYKFGTYEQHRGNIGDINALLFNAEQERFNTLKEWIFDLDGDSPKDGRAKEILAFVFEVITGVTGFNLDIKVEHQRKEIWVKINEDELILLDLLSEGFTKVFIWMGQFIKRLSECNPEMKKYKDAPAILIIDEIDTYLHPKWQRNILAFLAKTFTQTQFIVTTHSPLVANYLNGEEIEGGVALYRLEKGSEEPKRFDKIYGRDLSAIFHDWMGVENRIPAVDKQVDEILYLIDQETRTSLDLAKEKIAKLQFEDSDAIMAEILSSLEYAEENLEE